MNENARRTAARTLSSVLDRYEPSEASCRQLLSTFDALEPADPVRELQAVRCRLHDAFVASRGAPAPVVAIFDELHVEDARALRSDRAPGCVGPETTTYAPHSRPSTR